MKSWLKWTLGIIAYLVIGILLNKWISAPIVKLQQENPLDFYGPALLFRFMVFWAVYIAIGIGCLLLIKGLKKKKISAKRSLC